MFLNNYQNKKSIVFYDSTNTQALPTKLFTKSCRNCQLCSDSQLRGDTLQIGSHSQKGEIKFVRASQALQMQSLIIQLNSDFRLDWKIEFTISDKFQIRKRVCLGPSFVKEEKKYNQIQYPCLAGWSDDKWCFLEINLRSFQKAFDCFQYESLQSFSISGNCKLRKVTTLQNLNQINTKDVWMPQRHIVHYENKEDHAKLQNSEVSTVNQSIVICESLSLPKIENKLPTINFKSRKQSLKLRLPKIDNAKLNKIQSLKQSEQKNQRVSSEWAVYQKSKIFRVPKNRNITSESCKTIRKQGPGSKKMIFFQLNQMPGKSDGVNKENIPFQSNMIRADQEKKQVEKTKTKRRISGLFFNSKNCLKKIGAISERPKVFEDQIQEILQIQNSQISIETEKREKTQLITFFKNSKKRSQQGNSINQQKKSSIVQNKREKINSYEGFGEEKISNCLDLANRPYSPPFQDTVSQFKHMNSQKRGGQQQLQLVFDPTLNCFYTQNLDDFYSLKE